MDKFHISQFFNLPDDADLDFFDANLVYDSPVFIDPFLLKNSPVVEEVQLFDRFGDYFRYAYDKSLEMGLGLYTQTQLRQLLTVHEPKVINMGYAEASNQGHGPSLSGRLLSYFVDVSARRFVKETDAFPEHKFNPVSIQLFTNGIGFDGISDITANLIMDYLVKYTQEQSRLWGIPLESRMALDTNGFDFDEMIWPRGGYYELPKNPVRPDEPLILVPKHLLRGLEEVHDNTTGKVVSILRADDQLSIRFASLLEKKVADIDIEEIRSVFKVESSVHYRYLQALEEERNKPYDFNLDYLNLLAEKNYYKHFEGLTVPTVNSCDELNQLAALLVDEFNKEFSLRDGWKMAWRKTKTDMTPKIEPVIGRTMRSMGNMLARMYRDVTFLPESETGNGLVDFRLIYKDCTVVIELKLLKNNTKKGAEQIPAYLHGIRVQLPNYAELTEAKYAYYITGLHHNGVYDPTKNDLPRLNEVVNAREAVEAELKTKLPNFKELIHVNVNMVPRGSASDL